MEKNPNLLPLVYDDHDPYCFMHQLSMFTFVMVQPQKNMPAITPKQNTDMGLAVNGCHGDLVRS